jgi:hypothetical protein
MELPRALRTAVIAATGSLLGLAAASPPAQSGPVVLELYTSQGCSSCPPADALFATFVTRTEVIPLSFSVDYWNYLGWVDTFAKHEFTERQRAYALTRGDGQVYTPQVIVAGGAHVIGSDRAAIEAAIAIAQELPTVDVAVEVIGSVVHIDVAAAFVGGPTWGTVWIVLFDTEEAVEIGRGDNAGRTVSYRNIVMDMHRLAMWRGEAMSFELPFAEMEQARADGAAIIVQQERNGLPGPIVGAAMYTRPPA